MSAPLLQTERLKLIQVTPNDAAAVAAYRVRNRAHLAPWEPRRDGDFYTAKRTAESLAKSYEAFLAGTGYSFAIILRESGDLVGLCSFSNIVRGVFQACHLGYSIDAAYEGKGLMFEALSAAIAWMFNEVGLHRIMANHLPHNARSESVLCRLGFEREGYARSYLLIDGVWQDHVLNSLVNPSQP
jgi:ribosomal-protein-alanine N-acetyltransferase